ncbi:neutral/alkaline non-lysosomal ceramidase N-terminal domain-containing protein [Paenibacillus hodogayensis]|uniref:Neutral/alkaline non-lysosomal ceramidase N-terminal domain-containing protein n=1 Tax=Paenibacillus hodogayensis TaxID=279208 RepID=A0ABV5W558_9BACL
MELQLGTAKADITPLAAVPLAGFAVRQNKPYEGIRSRLYARVLYLRQQAEGSAMRQAVIVSADLLWWGSDRMPRIRQTLAERFGLAPEAIILNGTHNHSGPQTSFGFHRLLGQADVGYVDDLERKLVQAIAAAAANIEPVTIEKGEGLSGIGVQRRKYVDGRVIGGPNPEGPVDPEVVVLRFRTEKGAVKAVAVHYACHPVTTNENVVSAEFSGKAMESLERRLGGDAVCLFLQGACGDINIFKESAPAELVADRDIVDYFGLLLADTVGDVLEGPMRVLKPVPLEGRTVALPLRLKPLETRAELEALAAAGESPYDEWAEAMLRNPDGRPDRLLLELTRLDVAEGLSLLAMNAEVVVEYGLYVKAVSAGNVLPLPYSNGMIGYVPTQKQIAHGGYEPVLSTYYFHMPGRFDESVEDAMRAGLADMAGTGTSGRHERLTEGEAGGTFKA